MREGERIFNWIVSVVVVIVVSGLLTPLMAPAQAGMGSSSSSIPAGTLDPASIPKFVNQLPGPPPVYVPELVLDPVTGAVVSHNYTVTVTEFYQQILPGSLPATKVWGYGGLAKDAVTGKNLGMLSNSPAPTFEATRGIPINVKWVNELMGPHQFAVDPTLHWANPNMMPMMPPEPWPQFPEGFPDAQSPVPIVPHLHGGEVQSTSDGYPDAWFTSCGMQGMNYYSEEPTDANAAVYHYPNSQPATTLWYHDHALGITRINVMSGLAGFYLLRDPADKIATLLPKAKYDMPIVLQDRIFNTDGSFYYPSVGTNPDVHPYWIPQFYGNVPMINGLVSPNMNVDKGQYMLRLLDGSNARFYTVSFSVPSLGTTLPFTQIATDGGYLKAPVRLSQLTLAPGERATILVDFSGLKAGTKVIMTNSGSGCGGGGGGCGGGGGGMGGGGMGGGGMGGGGMGGGMGMMAPSIPQLMQFTVGTGKGQAAARLPTTLNPDLAVFPSLSSPMKTRILTLTEVQGANGPEAILLDGQKWMSPISEMPCLGSTELWVIVNPTCMPHPIHLHLVQFQLVSRQQFSHMGYYGNWLSVNGQPPLNHPTIEVPIGPYLMGSPVPAPANEQGWKDTIQANMGQVTTIIVRFSPIDGSIDYPFDATEGPGYVWHCHILDHEDNEMMRPYVFMGMEPPMPDM